MKKTQQKPLEDEKSGIESCTGSEICPAENSSLHLWYTVSLLVRECWGWRITLHCHGNWFQKTLLTDYLPLETQRYSKMHLYFCISFTSSWESHSIVCFASLWWRTCDIIIHPCGSPSTSACIPTASVSIPQKCIIPIHPGAAVWSGKNHPNITSVTPLFNGLYVPTKVGRTLLVLGSSFCQMHLLPPPATRMDTSGRNPGSLGENLVALTTGPQLLILSNVKNGSEAHKGKYNRYWQSVIAINLWKKNFVPGWDCDSAVVCFLFIGFLEIHFVFCSVYSRSKQQQLYTILLLVLFMLINNKVNWGTSCSCLCCVMWHFLHFYNV